MAVQCASFPLGNVVITPNALGHLAPIARLMPLQSALEIGGCELAQSIGSDNDVAEWE